MNKLFYKGLKLTQNEYKEGLKDMIKQLNFVYILVSDKYMKRTD